jgi:peptidoglycan/LPS O-acetylase OafA/YrhL
MGGLRKERHDQAAYTPRGRPLDFAEGRLVYTSQMHRRNRMYRLAAALLILAIGTGVVVVLFADWLSTLAK